MGQAKTLSGGCLCGAVRFTAKPRDHDYSACHCAMCRRWSAGPFLGLECGGTVRVEDESNLGVYKSTEWAERQFCKACGSSLFYKLTDHNFYFVSSEAFDDNEDFRLVSEIFVDEKPSHYDFANDTTKRTGAEVFAEAAAAQAASKARSDDG